MIDISNTTPLKKVADTSRFSIAILKCFFITLIDFCFLLISYSNIYILPSSKLWKNTVSRHVTKNFKSSPCFLNFVATRPESVAVLCNSILSIRRFFQYPEPYDNLRKYNIRGIPNKFILFTFGTWMIQQKQNKDFFKLI